MNPLDWALAADVPHAEKLVLVYLASRANRAGVGLWDRDELETTLRYKRRSVQRILKALREAGLLVDAGDWYVLQLPWGNGDVPPEGLKLAPGPAVPINATYPPGDARRGEILTETELERIKEVIASSTIDSVEYLMDQLANFEQRLAGELARFLHAQKLHVEQREPAPPEPDPVLEDPRYQQLIDMGFSETAAYENVEHLLEYVAPVPGQGDVPEQAGERETRSAAAGATNGPEARHPAPGQYADNASGRLQRVADILGTAVTDKHRALWRELEDTENRHTVKGETDAFELLYPAIVAAARTWTGSLEQFLDFEAVRASAAPWDQDPAPTPAEDAALEAEIHSMLAELAAINDPRASVQPRTEEKGDDGIHRTETIVGYHRRVRAVYQQVMKLKEMGAMS